MRPKVANYVARYISANTTGFTAGDVPLYIVTTVGGHMTAIDDRRAWVVF